MAIYEEHFIGFDPTQGLEQLQQCPVYPNEATIVWFEKYLFTGWNFGILQNTGISYVHCYLSFDINGNVLTDAPIAGGQCCGFTGNTTCGPFQICPTFEQWLSKARSVCEKWNLPAPGTVQLSPRYIADIGTRFQTTAPAPP